LPGEIEGDEPPAQVHEHDERDKKI
jgi:hypothetical protein